MGDERQSWPDARTWFSFGRSPPTGTTVSFPMQEKSFLALSYASHAQKFCLLRLELLLGENPLRLQRTQPLEL